MTERALRVGRRGCLALGAAAFLGGCEQQVKRSNVTISAAGATFPYPLYERWRMEYARETGVVVAYSPSGSSDGILAITTDRTEFAGTDVPMTDEELDQAGDVLHVPMTLGAVAVAYNSPGVPKELELDGETLGRIFLGEIKTWNDPAISALNPGEALPSRPIALVTRADGSGTTKVFTEYLANVSGSFKEKLGSSTKLRWPAGFAVQGNNGVADTILRKQGSIGYLNTAFAAARRLDVAAIKNRAGEFQLPKAEGATEAAEKSAARVPQDLRMSIVNAEGQGSYPISGYSYALIRREAPDPTLGAEAVRFLYWGLHDGQRYAPSLGYAELAESIVARAVAQLQKVQYQGKALLEPP